LLSASLQINNPVTTEPLDLKGDNGIDADQFETIDSAQSTVALIDKNSDGGL
jgi:hypothetical protein